MHTFITSKIIVDDMGLLCFGSSMGISMPVKFVGALAVDWPPSYRY